MQKHMLGSFKKHKTNRVSSLSERQTLTAEISFQPPTSQAFWISRVIAVTGKFPAQPNAWVVVEEYPQVAVVNGKLYLWLWTFTVSSHSKLRVCWEEYHCLACLTLSDKSAWEDSPSRCVLAISVVPKQMRRIPANKAVVCVVWGRCKRDIQEKCILGRI